MAPSITHAYDGDGKTDECMLVGEDGDACLYPQRMHPMFFLDIRDKRVTIIRSVWGTDGHPHTRIIWQMSRDEAIGAAARLLGLALQLGR